MIKTKLQRNNKTKGRMAFPASSKAFFEKHPNNKSPNNKQKSGRKTYLIIFYFLLFAFPSIKAVFLPAPFPLKIKINSKYSITNKEIRKALSQNSKIEQNAFNRSVK